MIDLLGRPLRDLRISVTDRCNLRCRYCMPREVYGPAHQFMARSELLSFEEITRVTRVLAGRGLAKVRITGGEPLLRRELARLIEMIAAIEGIDDLALTTNGLLLAGQAKTLAQAGLGRVTVSLDALEESALHAMSDAPIAPQRILEGIEAASEAGLSPVKINMVVRRGVNDHCVVAMAEHFRNRPEVLRFIEYMDVGSSNGWRMEEVLPASEILELVADRWPLEQIPQQRAGAVATRYRYLDGAGEIGLIHSVSAPFCHACTRLRLSADGKLLTCLFARSGQDLRSLLRGGIGDGALEESLGSLWAARTDRYSADRARMGESGGVPGVASGPKLEMSYIGG